MGVWLKKHHVVCEAERDCGWLCQLPNTLCWVTSDFVWAKKLLMRKRQQEKNNGRVIWRTSCLREHYCCKQWPCQVLNHCPQSNNNKSIFWFCRALLVHFWNSCYWRGWGRHCLPSIFSCFCFSVLKGTGIGFTRVLLGEKEVLLEMKRLDGFKRSVCLFIFLWVYFAFYLLLFCCAFPQRLHEFW